MKVPAIFGAVCLAVLSVCASPAAGQTKIPPGATSPANEKKYGVYPIAYREIITRWLGERLLDPASAKIEFQQPKPVDVRQSGGNMFHGYSVEYKVNSRNNFGMYTGFQKFRVLMRNGEILRSERVKN